MRIGYPRDPIATPLGLTSQLLSHLRLLARFDVAALVLAGRAIVTRSVSKENPFPCLRCGLLWPFAGKKCRAQDEDSFAGVNATVIDYSILSVAGSLSQIAA